jgi:recombination associated protein RdgC
MGAFRGGLTLRSFGVDGDPPENFRSEYATTLRAKAARAPDPDGDSDVTMGWAVTGDPLDTDFSEEKFHWNEYIVVTFRKDSLKVPAGLLDAHLRRRAAEEAAERGVEKLSRDERKSLKQLVERDLKRKMLPSMRTVDVVWSLAARRAYVWTHNATLIEEIEQGFLEVFGRNLLGEDPGGRVPQAKREALTPADFTGSAGGA